MRDLHNNVYPKRALSPVVAGTDNTPYVSQILDLQGYEAAELLIMIGANTDADVMPRSPNASFIFVTFSAVGRFSIDLPISSMI